MLACHAQEGLGDTPGMLQAMAMQQVLPVGFRIAMQSAPLLAALPLMGGGIPYWLIVD